MVASIAPAFNDAQREFIDAIRAAGMKPPDHIEPGNFYRFPGAGKAPHNAAGWCRLFPDGTGGVYGDWSTGLSETWQVKRDKPTTWVERAAWQRQVREAQARAKAAREAAQAEAAERAASILEAAEPAPADHAYLKRKDVQVHGLKLHGGALIVPMRSAAGALCSLQFIDADGGKRFLSDGRTGGTYHAIGKPNGQLLVCEGYATGATLHESTGHAVAVAFNAGNLLPVAQALHDKLPDVRMVICADDDAATPGNPGLSKAREAAHAVGAALAVPDFGDNRPDGASDFNDLAQHCGADAVARCVDHAKPVDAETDGNSGNPGNKPTTARPSGVPTPVGTGGNTGNAGAFRVTDKGVYFTHPGGDLAPTRICSRLDVTAATRDERGENWGRLLEFKDRDQREHQWAMPMQTLSGDGGEYRSVLLSAGLEIEPNTTARRLLTTYIQTAKVEARAICTERTGWHRGAYVLPTGTLGENGERVILQTMGEPPTLEQCGTLEGWRDNVASQCVGNSRLVLAVSMAFAAPLLEITGAESGGVHLVGASSTGKTTALHVAASVWSGKDRLHRWRATSNGLEAVAQTHNDALLLLDELAQVDPREAGEAAYMLSNGSGKHRARRDGLARQAMRWRLLFLSSGEIGLADHMREAGKRSRAGQEVRLADVPADAGAGHGLFEDLHGHEFGAEFSTALMAAMEGDHGVAAPAYIAALVEIDRNELRKRIDELTRTFCTDALPKKADGQARRVAARFGLIAAAGELATGMGITGWQDDEATQAAKQCFEAWLDRRGGAGAQEDKAAISQVRHFLELHGSSRFADVDNPTDRPIINQAGYKQAQGESKTLYLFSPEVFRAEVCGGLDYRNVAVALQRAGMLKINEGADRLTYRKRGIGRCYAVIDTREGQHE